jgi:hypothetical protein
MLIVEEEKTLKFNCVLMDCTKKAIAMCNNCRIPVCNLHSKRIANQIYLCINCFEFSKRIKSRR